MPIEDDEPDCRERFYRLVNARRTPVFLAEAKNWLIGLLEALPRDFAPSAVDDLLVPKHGPAVPSQATGAHPTDNTGSILESAVWHDADADALAFHAPVALLEGAWLQAVATAANGHREETAGLFAAYLALLGEDESASPAFAYRALLSRAGVALPCPASWRFAHHPRVGAAALRMACVQLALGWRGAEFFAEALGFTLGYLRSASPWRMPGLSAENRRNLLASMDTQARTALEAHRSSGGSDDRVLRGYALFASEESRYLAELGRFIRRKAAPADKVADLFRRKLEFARGYHAKIKLGNRSLEDWFSDYPFDAPGFLAAFAVSPFLQGKPGTRPFDRLISFGGPMFGVFDAQEQSLIDAWLASLETAPAAGFGPQEFQGNTFPPLENIGPDRNFEASVRIEPGESRPSTSSRRTELIRRVHLKDENSTAESQPEKTAGKQRPWSGLARLGGSILHPRSISVRELFNRLINDELSGEIQECARARTRGILARARRAGARKGFLGERDFVYSPQGFAGRIARHHRREVARHAPSEPPPRLSRETYAWGIRQFAPAILADGCWLQHFGEAARQDSRLHRLLFRIYAEELGDGRARWNHPAVFRNLLEDLKIYLPPATSPEFARHPSLLDSAFDLPAYLLAISKFPQDYLPEIIGLNLAIELSGLGAGYLRLAEELKYWKIDPLIVTLHLSIDNLAGGHAAMAAESVQIHLEDVRLSGGEQAMGCAWERVLSGYHSLESSTRRFKWELILAFLRRSAFQRLLT